MTRRGRDERGVRDGRHDDGETGQGDETGDGDRDGDGYRDWIRGLWETGTGTDMQGWDTGSDGDRRPETGAFMDTNTL